MFNCSCWPNKSFFVILCFAKTGTDSFCPALSHIPYAYVFLVGLWTKNKSYTPTIYFTEFPRAVENILHIVIEWIQNIITKHFSTFTIHYSLTYTVADIIASANVLSIVWLIEGLKTLIRSYSDSSWCLQRVIVSAFPGKKKSIKNVTISDSSLICPHDVQRWLYFHTRNNFSFCFKYPQNDFFLDDFNINLLK